MTLDADDRKAEYLFQNQFSVVPQVIYSVCGYNFDLDSRPDSYNNYYKEPNALGLFVTAGELTVTYPPRPVSYHFN